MNYHTQIIGDIESHSVDGIKNCFKNGVDANGLYNGEPLIFELTSEYTRSPRFKDCVKAFVEYGLQFDDKLLLAVLLDDSSSLDKQLTAQPDAIYNRYTLRCAFTPLIEATLLHICAEFNHVSCAKVLLMHGADVNAPAGVDVYGFGGQTPIFHTVNQLSHDDILHYLLLQSADLEITIRGVIWGSGYPWETFIPSVNPISYAMMGLLPQMHRKEAVVFNTVRQLLKIRYDIDYSPSNIPNKYLAK